MVEGIGALMLTALLFAFVEYTETGRAMRAVAEDRVAATLMGIDVQRINGLAFGIGAACVGAAGALADAVVSGLSDRRRSVRADRVRRRGAGGFGSIRARWSARCWSGCSKCSAASISRPS